MLSRPNAHCFRPASRLKAKQDFLRVRNEPTKQRVFKQCLNLTMASTNKPARLGITVPKRHLKTAVARNKLKRQVREHFRKHQAHLYGFDMVVTLSQKWTLGTNQALFKKQVSSLFEHALKQLPKVLELAC